MTVVTATETPTATAPAAAAPETPPADPAAQPPTDAAPPPEKDEGKFSARFSALTTRERKLQEEKNALKAEREALAKEREEISAVRAENEKLKSLQAQAKKDPLEFMKAHGLTYQEVTDFILRGKKALEPEDVDRMVEEKLSAAEKKRKEEEEARALKEQERLLAEEKATVEREFDEFAKTTIEFINAHPEDYELVLVQGAEDQVFSVIAEYFKATGEVLEPKVAADKVEAYLLDKAMKLAQSKKLTASSTQTKVVRDSKQDVRDTPKPSPTLTNDKAPAADRIPPPKSDKERYARAIARLNGQPPT